jgi:glycosyltransferase involved in cell wall biosynthesis
VVKMYYSVVVPAHNESSNLPKLVEGLERVLRREHMPFEIIIVNDNSTDDSEQVLLRLSKKFKELRHITRKTNPGVGNAKREGFGAARGKFIITLDGDLSHDPSELPKLLEKRDSYDVVCGSRYVEKGRADMTLSRKMISGAFNLFFRLLIGIKIKDFTSGYRVIRRGVIKKLRLESGTFGIYIEIPLKAHIYGFRLCEVPITYHKRQAGVSKLNYMRQGPEYLKVGLNAFLLRIKKAVVGL